MNLSIRALILKATFVVFVLSFGLWFWYSFSNISQDDLYQDICTPYTYDGTNIRELLTIADDEIGIDCDFLISNFTQKRRRFIDDEVIEAWDLTYKDMKEFTPLFTDPEKFVHSHHSHQHLTIMEANFFSQGIKGGCHLVIGNIRLPFGISTKFQVKKGFVEKLLFAFESMLGMDRFFLFILFEVLFGFVISYCTQ